MCGDLLAGLAEQVHLRPGAPETDLRNAERELGVALPHDLRVFLSCTDGFYDPLGQYEYAWRLAEVVTQNETGWAEGWWPAHLLTFGGDGAGDYFAVRLEGPPSVRHFSTMLMEESDLQLRVADFWRAWIDGSVSV